MRAKKIDPKKKTPEKKAEEAIVARMKSNQIATGSAKAAAAKEAARASAEIRDRAVSSGGDFQGTDRMGNPIKPAAGYAVQANVLGGDGPKMDTGKGARGGTSAQVRKAKRRVSQSAASPQAKKAARRIY